MCFGQRSHRIGQGCQDTHKSSSCSSVRLSSRNCHNRSRISVQGACACIGQEKLLILWRRCKIVWLLSRLLWYKKYNIEAQTCRSYGVKAMFISFKVFMNLATIPLQIWLKRSSRQAKNWGRRLQALNMTHSQYVTIFRQNRRRHPWTDANVNALVMIPEQVKAEKSQRAHKHNTEPGQLFHRAGIAWGWADAGGGGNRPGGVLTGRFCTI